MLKLVWDPLKGDCVPEGRVVKYVSDILYHFLNDDGTIDYDVNLPIGQDTILNEFRVRIVRGQVKYSEMAVVFEGQTLAFNEYAKLDNWPKGLAELSMNQLMELVGVAQTPQVAPEEDVSMSVEPPSTDVGLTDGQ